MDEQSEQIDRTPGEGSPGVVIEGRYRWWRAMPWWWFAGLPAWLLAMLLWIGSDVDWWTVLLLLVGLGIVAGVTLGPVLRMVALRIDRVSGRFVLPLPPPHQQAASVSGSLSDIIAVHVDRSVTQGREVLDVLVRDESGGTCWVRVTPAVSRWPEIRAALLEVAPRRVDVRRRRRGRYGRRFQGTNAPFVRSYCTAPRLRVLVLVAAVVGWGIPLLMPLGFVGLSVLARAAAWSNGLALWLIRTTPTYGVVVPVVHMVCLAGMSLCVGGLLLGLRLGKTRIRRARLSLCPRCLYDFSGTAPIGVDAEHTCPECASVMLVDVVREQWMRRSVGRYKSAKGVLVVPPEEEFERGSRRRGPERESPERR